MENEILKFISETDLFVGLNDEEKGKLAEIATEEVLEKGDVLFEEGDEGDRLYIIKSGVIEIGKEGKEEEFTRLSRLSEGEIFGELAVFDNRPRSATAVVSVYPEVELLVFEQQDLEKVIEENPNMGIKILSGIIEKLGDRLRRADEALKALLRSLDYTSL